MYAKRYAPTLAGSVCVTLAAALVLIGVATPSTAWSSKKARAAHGNSHKPPRSKTAKAATIAPADTEDVDIDGLFAPIAMPSKQEANKAVLQRADKHTRRRAQRVKTTRKKAEPPVKHQVAQLLRSSLKAEPVLAGLERKPGVPVAKVGTIANPGADAGKAKHKCKADPNGKRVVIAKGKSGAVVFGKHCN